VRRELFDHERVDRLAQRLVLLGEDEVAPRGGVIGLLDFGRGHSANLRGAVRVELQMPFETVRYDVAANGVATIAMNRPEARNALSDQLLDDLLAAFTAARDDDAVRCVVLTSTHDKVFSAGGDLAGFAAEAPLIDKFFATDRFPRLFQLIGGLGKPTLCAANGHVLAGALGLALACDLIVAKDGARFGTPEINVGIFPFMIMALIYRNVGRKKTNELLLLGEQIDAHEAERIGIVNTVAGAGEFDAVVADWAGRLAARSPLLMRLGKDAMYRQQDLGLADAIEYLHGRFTLALSTHDIQEGVRAFFEKREPVWTGH
jgi:enoyl-CoA hydratase